METEAKQEIYELLHTTAVCMLSLFWFISSNQKARKKHSEKIEKRKNRKKKKKKNKEKKTEIMGEIVIFRIL